MLILDNGPLVSGTTKSIVRMNHLPRFTPARIGVCVVLCALLCPGRAATQVSKHVSLATNTEPIPGRDLTVTASLNSSSGVVYATIVYRPFGESQYRRADMDVRGTNASVTLPGSFVQPPSIEYYIVLTLSDGSFETYPFGDSQDPFSNPPDHTLRIIVEGVASATGVVFLSPDSDEPMAPEDVVVCFSLLRAPSGTDRRATRVQLDGADITAVVVMSGELGVFSPENSRLTLTPGRHEVAVSLFDSAGVARGTASRVFTVAGELLAAEEQAGVTYAGSVALESRHEQVAGEGTWYNRATIAARAMYEGWRFTTNAFITTDESPSLQPQDRFYIGAETSWLKAGYGDLNPSFPDLILSGKRVRGVHANLKLGFFGLAMSTGQITRPIEGSLLSKIPDSLLVTEQSSDPGAAYAPISPGLWGKYSFGTYGRNLFIIRPSFGTGETWQWGLTYMNSKDDMGSIAYGIRPQEDVVVGSDFVVRLDDRRIQLAGQGAFSLYNTDISSGSITNDRIDSLWPNSEDTRNTVRWLRNILTRFITVNENLRPLSLTRLSTAVGEASVQLRYFQQDLKFTYLYRGSDYNSFGQAFLRKDIQGFNVNDRFHLIENALTVTTGYERLHDNTSKTKAGTTYYSTFTLAMTYAPRIGFPPITVGYSRYGNSNNINTLGQDSLSAIEDVTNRIFLQSSYDFEFGMEHTASFNLSTSNRTDKTPRALNVNNTSVGLSLATRYASALTTSIDLALNYNKLPVSGARGQTTRLDYNTLGLQARYEILKEILTTQATVSPTFGDFHRTILNLQAEWQFAASMHLVGEFGYLASQADANESYVTIHYRYDL